MHCRCPIKDCIISKSSDSDLPYFLEDGKNIKPSLQVNLCQMHLFLHQLNHNMTEDCSLNYEFSTWKLQTQKLLCTQIVFLFLFWHSEQFMYKTCSELVVFMYWTGKSMNNLLSYCGLVDARIRASNKDLPVKSVI